MVYKVQMVHKVQMIQKVHKIHEVHEVDKRKWQDGGAITYVIGLEGLKSKMSRFYKVQDLED